MAPQESLGLTIDGDASSNESRPNTQVHVERDLGRGDTASITTGDEDAEHKQKDCHGPPDSLIPGCEHVKAALENPVTFKKLVAELKGLERRKGGGGKGDGGGSSGGGSGGKGKPSGTGKPSGGGSGGSGGSGTSGGGGYGYGSGSGQTGSGDSSSHGTDSEKKKKTKIYIGAGVGGFVGLVFVGTVVYCCLLTEEQKSEVSDLGGGCLEGLGNICCALC